jgi:hypothetical protein
MIRKGYVPRDGTNGQAARASIPDHIEEKTMGTMGNMVSRVLGKGRAPATTTAQGQYIPASQSQGTMDALGTQANAVLQRATDVYRRNPKLVGGIGLVALAALLVKVKQGR